MDDRRNKFRHRPLVPMIAAHPPPQTESLLERMINYVSQACSKIAQRIGITAARPQQRRDLDRTRFKHSLIDEIISEKPRPESKQSLLGARKRPSEVVVDSKPSFEESVRAFRVLDIQILNEVQLREDNMPFTERITTAAPAGQNVRPKHTQVRLPVRTSSKRRMMIDEEDVEELTNFQRPLYENKSSLQPKLLKKAVKLHQAQKEAKSKSNNKEDVAVTAAAAVTPLFTFQSNYDQKEKMYESPQEETTRGQQPQFPHAKVEEDEKPDMGKASSKYTTVIDSGLFGKKKADIGSQLFAEFKQDKPSPFSWAVPKGAPEAKGLLAGGASTETPGKSSDLKKDSSLCVEESAVTLKPTDDEPKGPVVEEKKEDELTQDEDGEIEFKGGLFQNLGGAPKSDVMMGGDYENSKPSPQSEISQKPSPAISTPGMFGKKASTLFATKQDPSSLFGTKQESSPVLFAPKSSEPVSEAGRGGGMFNAPAPSSQPLFPKTSSSFFGRKQEEEQAGGAVNIFAQSQREVQNEMTSGEGASSSVFGYGSTSLFDGLRGGRQRRSARAGKEQPQLAYKENYSYQDMSKEDFSKFKNPFSKSASASVTAPTDSFSNEKTISFASIKTSGINPFQHVGAGGGSLGNAAGGANSGGSDMMSGLFGDVKPRMATQSFGREDDDLFGDGGRRTKKARLF